jgi:hypothetical protein
MIERFGFRRAFGVRIAGSEINVRRCDRYIDWCGLRAVDAIIRLIACNVVVLLIALDLGKL